MNEMVRKQANLRLLQRSDPLISDILGSATHVVLYNFQDSSQSWEKGNVEGSLFLAARQQGFVLLILNRNSPENYQMLLTKDFQLQHKDPFLIFKQEENDKTAIRGIWFPNAQERISVNSMLTQVLDQLRSMPEEEAAAAETQAAAAAALGALLSPGVVVSGSRPTPIQTDASATMQSPPPAQATPAAGATTPSAGNGPTLDKKSLQLALLSLIQDDRFLDLLHAQYLKVAHARSSKTPR